MPMRSPLLLNEDFLAEVASDFRSTILSRGGTVHPQILYNKFRGKPATIDAMLVRDGLQPQVKE